MEVARRPAAPEAAAAPQGRRSDPPPRRAIRTSDVVKALEIAADRLGDVDRSCLTLRAWAAAGRVTPAGQVLTVEAVDKGIEAWLAKRSGVPPPPAKHGGGPADSSERKPATPLTRRPSAGGEDDSAAEAATAGESGARPGAKRPRKGPYERKATYEECKEERSRTLAHVKELTANRLVEVMAEIGGHMEEIVRRSGDGALARWLALPETASDDERRELYQRLVHAEPDPDVRSPEELCAELLPHQLEGLEWLASLHANGLHGILADEMGLGKTIQTIALLLYLQERKGNVGPHLIVAPKSTLPNWQAEFGRFAPNYGVHVLKGEPQEREAELAKFRQAMAAGRAAALVTNYEQVHRNDWLFKTKWQLVVVDEGHRLKNPETILHTAMKQLQCRMRLLLTGTPLQNCLNELWALLHYLLPELFTQLMDFKSWFSNPFQGLPGINQYEIQPDPEQEQHVIARMHALLSPFLLQRLKKDVLADKLPPRSEVIVRVPLSAWQAAAYADMENRTIRLLSDDDGVSSEQVNNALMQLRKIALHPYLFQESFASDADLFRTSGKLEALDRLLSKLLRFSHKVLIFSQFTSVLDILEAFVKWRGIRYVRLDGQVRHEQRRDRIEQFQTDPELSVFLISARAGSLGLNLQAADTVVLFDLDWNPQNDKQAIARVHRVGQTKEVRVVRIMTNAPIERHMEQRCKEKLELEEKIMGAGMFRRQATAEQRRSELRAMFGLPTTADGRPAPERPGATVGAGTEDEITPTAEVNRLLARSADELAAFDKMDAAVLRPRRGANKADSLLVQSGRLMAPSEVPAGFTGMRVDDD